MFKTLKVGDPVIRMLCNIPMPMSVLAIKDDRLVCGGPEYPGADWEFCIETGAEIDDYLDWGPPPRMTGSYLIPPNKIN